MKTKIKPAFKIFLAALIVGVVFGAYFAFAPKKEETKVIEQASVGNTVAIPEAVAPAPPTVVKPTYTAPEAETNTVATNVVNEKTSTTTNETTASTKKQKSKVKKESVATPETKTKKKTEDRENLNVNFN